MTRNYYKVWQVSQSVRVITKCDRKLLQSVTGTNVTGITMFDRKLLQNVKGFTKCDKKLLKSVAGITKCES